MGKLFNNEQVNFIKDMIGNDDTTKNGAYKNKNIIDAFINKFGDSIDRQNISKKITYIRNTYFKDKSNKFLDNDKKILLSLKMANDMRDLIGLDDNDYQIIRKIIFSKA